MFGRPEDNHLYPIFVYGTLRRGGNKHDLLRHRTLHEQPALAEGMALFSLGAFPMMIPSDGVVYGELITLQPFLHREIMADLDRLEGYSPQNRDASLYQRDLIMVHSVDRAVIQMAWAYVGQQGLLKSTDLRIEGGDWLQHRQQLLQKTRFGRFYED